MTFDQILGHARQKEILSRSLASGRLAHAYLFSGPDGVGKRLMALALARAIVCHEQRGCGDCQACRKIDHRNHPDLHVLEPDGNSIKIEQVRSLQKGLNLKPLEAPRKICLIEAADSMTLGAANALLKTLEEPPPYVLFIFATTEPNKVLPTILSRCQRFDFRRISVPEIVERLKDICQEEDITADEASLLLIARKGDGALRDARSFVIDLESATFRDTPIVRTTSLVAPRRS